jgi:Flp pilus assembly protein TadG
MFGENQPAHVVRQLRRHLDRFPEKFAFLLRSAFGVSLRTGILATQRTKTVSPQPRSGVRMQPTAQAVGKLGTRLAPAGRKISSRAHTFSAAISGLQPGTVSAAEATGANSPRPSQTPINSAKRERMVPPQPPARRFSHLRATDAAALIEFAVALPLLVVLVVGIFDFGGAFNLKQKLNNAVREGARFASTQPTNDLALPQPPSVNAVRVLVDSYLQTAGINDCGLSSASWATGGGFLWHFAASGNGCSMTLDVSRSVQVQETVVGQPAVQMLCTTVNIIYPYQWHFNSVIQLLVPGAHYTFTDLHSDATAVNMD